MHTVRTGKVIFGTGNGPFVFIGGPCVIESERSTMAHAEKLVDLCSGLKIPFIFKSSYDKANRSSLKSYRGPGLCQGLAILEKVKRTFDIPVLSDVHTMEEILVASEVLDVIQIPALLCRQTDFVVAVARTGKVINVKKGQFMSPWEVKNIIEKITSQGNDRVLITERGCSFGYNNLVSDFRAVPIIRNMGYPVVFDATHSVQMPGGLGHASGGRREFIPVLSRAAVAAGVDALFMEVHTNPAKALCDGPNSLPLKELEPLLELLLAIRKAVAGK